MGAGSGQHRPLRPSTWARNSRQHFDPVLPACDQQRLARSHTEIEGDVDASSQKNGPYFRGTIMRYADGSV